MQKVVGMRTVRKSAGNRGFTISGAPAGAGGRGSVRRRNFPGTQVTGAALATLGSHSARLRSDAGLPMLGRNIGMTAPAD